MKGCYVPHRIDGFCRPVAVNCGASHDGNQTQLTQEYGGPGGGIAGRVIIPRDRGACRLRQHGVRPDRWHTHDFVP